MKILSIFSFLLFLACTPQKKELQEPLDKAKEQWSQAKPAVAGLQFSIDFAPKVENFEGIVLNASLINTREDTLYFLSSSCAGEMYSVRYDSTSLRLVPMLSCNESYPLVLQIAPKKSFRFLLHFEILKKNKNLCMGFDFHQVSSTFRFDTETVSASEIHHRMPGKQTICWSDPIAWP